MAPSNMHDPDHKKRSTLEQAVKAASNLAAIAQSDLLDVQKGNTALTYEAYVTLLQQAAYQHDEAHNTSRRRHVHVSNTNIKQKSNGSSKSYRSGFPRLPPSVWGPLPSSVKSTINDAQRSYNSNKKTRFPRLDRPVWHELPHQLQQQIRTFNGIPSRRGHSYRSTSVSGATSSTSSPISQSSGTHLVHSTQVATSAAPSRVVTPSASTATASDIPTLRDIMSSSRTNSTTSSSPSTDGVITVNGTRFVRVDFHSVTYSISEHHQQSSLNGSLIDGGANGGMSGSDVRVLEVSDRTADVKGIGDHTLTGIRLSTVAGVISTNKGDAVGLFHQYAHVGQGKTIHSIGQMEHFGLDVNDRSISLRHGKQRIVTPDGYVIPLQLREGLAYMDMRPPTDHDLATLPHITFTSDADWDPRVLDNEITASSPSLLDGLADAHLGDTDTRVSDLGEYLGHHTIVDRICCAGRCYVPTAPDLVALQPKFGWLNTNTIQRTLEQTTQYARNVCRLPMRKHFKSRFPALNVHRRNEPVATDTIWSDTPSVDGGYKAAQLFVGRKTLVADIYPVRSDSDFSATLEDNIRSRGAMDLLISDRAQAETSRKVTDLLRMYRIRDYQSEPHHQHQNYAENRIGHIKRCANRVLERSGAPASCWLLAVAYVVYLLNTTACGAIDFQIPLQVLTGQTADISAVLQFHFFEPVYFSIDQSFPSTSTEQRGRWVGFADSVGDALTWRILVDATQKIIFRSAVRSADVSSGAPANLRADASLDGELFGGAKVSVPPSSTRSIVLSRDADLDPATYRAPTFLLTSCLAGRSCANPNLMDAVFVLILSRR